MGEAELVLLMLMLAVGGLSVLAGAVRVPYPIVLVLGGLVLGFVPGVPPAELPRSRWGRSCRRPTRWPPSPSSGGWACHGAWSRCWRVRAWSTTRPRWSPTGWRWPPWWPELLAVAGRPAVRGRRGRRRGDRAGGRVADRRGLPPDRGSDGQDRAVGGGRLRRLPAGRPPRPLGGAGRGGCRPVPGLARSPAGVAGDPAAGGLLLGGAGLPAERPAV